MAYEQIRCEVNEAVATITLNRPERLNAWTGTMGRELTEAFTALDRDDSVRAVVVTGAGRAFCAGADIEAGAETFTGRGRAELEAAQSPSRHPPVRPWEVRKPVIAAINGAAVGVGATLPMQFDIRLAAESARIGFIFVRRGLVPEALSTWLLPRAIGTARAAELMLTGRILSAREALAYGLVSQVLPDGELLSAAHAMAREIAVKTAPVAVAVTKRLLWHMQTEGDPERALALETEAFWWAAAQPDAAEGIAAFLQKREASWSMRPSSDLPEFLPGPR